MKTETREKARNNAPIANTFGYPAKAEEPREAALAAGLQAGDPEAYEELLRRYEGQIYRRALRFTRSEADAEEVVQNVFLQVFRKIHTFTGDSALSTWLYTVTTNEARMLLRKGRRIREVSVESDDGDGPEPYGTEAETHWSHRPAERLDSRELVNEIENALELLPGEQRIVFVMRDVEEKTNEETAKELGITVAAVKSRLHRARLALRKSLERAERAERVRDVVRPPSSFDGCTPAACCCG